MASKKIGIEIDLDARKAQKAAKDLNRELQGTEDALEDVESAGKQLARAMQSQADDMISEIESTRRAVDQLEQALGPDFDGDPTKIVADLKKVGLTAQEIEADADELAAAFKRAGDVKLSATQNGFKDVESAVSGVRDEAARTSSTVANFVGNSVEELPGVSAALGPVITGFGQLAEGAAEGEINVKQLVTAGLGFAAFGLVLKTVQTAMSSMAASKAFHKDRAESFAEAVGEVGDSVEAVNQALEGTNRLTGRTGGMAGFFENTTDVTAELVELGYTQEEVNKAIAEGGPVLEAITRRFKEAADASRDEADALNNAGKVTVDALEKANRYDDAVEVLNETRGEYVKGVEEGTIAEAYLADAVDETKDATEDAETAADAYSDVIERVGRALDLTTRKFDAMSGRLSDRSTYLTAEQGLKDLATQAVETGDVSESQVIDMKQDILDYGRTLTDEASKERIAEINTAIDQGDYNLAAWALAQLERTRTVRYNIAMGTASGATNTGRIGGVPVFHTGGMAGGDKFTSDEVPAVLQKGEMVLTEGQQASVAQAMTGGTAGGSGAIYLTVNAGIGTNGSQVGRQIVDVLEAHYRNGGRPPRSA